MRLPSNFAFALLTVCAWSDGLPREHDAFDTLVLAGDTALYLGETTFDFSTPWAASLLSVEIDAVTSFASAPGAPAVYGAQRRFRVALAHARSPQGAGRGAASAAAAAIPRADALASACAVVSLIAPWARVHPCGPRNMTAPPRPWEAALGQGALVNARVVRRDGTLSDAGAGGPWLAPIDEPDERGALAWGLGLWPSAGKQTSVPIALTISGADTDAFGAARPHGIFFGNETVPAGSPFEDWVASRGSSQYAAAKGDGTWSSLGLHVSVIAEPAGGVRVAWVETAVRSVSHDSATRASEAACIVAPVVTAPAPSEWRRARALRLADTLCLRGAQRTREHDAADTGADTGDLITNWLSSPSVWRGAPFAHVCQTVVKPGRERRARVTVTAPSFGNASRCIVAFAHALPRGATVDLDALHNAWRALGAPNASSFSDFFDIEVDEGAGTESLLITHVAAVVEGGTLAAEIDLPLHVRHGSPGCRSLSATPAADDDETEPPEEWADAVRAAMPQSSAPAARDGRVRAGAACFLPLFVPLPLTHVRCEGDAQWRPLRAVASAWPPDARFDGGCAPPAAPVAVGHADGAEAAARATVWLVAGGCLAMCAAFIVSSRGPRRRRDVKAPRRSKLM